MLDRESFEPFFRHEYAHLVLYLQKNGASEAEAEDAVQEAMIQAMRLWEQIISPRAWSRKAAFTCFVRQAERARRESPLPESWTLLTGHVDPIEGQREEQLRVITIMRKLPPEQRKVVALFYDGLSVPEIAAIVDKPAVTVRSLLRHARTRLKEVVQSEGFDSLGTAS